jgi:uncharacterized membrane protein HdeD (DUF308 family)
MLFGAWALATGLSQIVASRRVEGEPDRGPRTTFGVIAAGVGLVPLLWPGTGIVTISWVIALAALLLAALLELPGAALEASVGAARRARIR